MEKEDTKKDHKKHGHGAPQHGRAMDRKDGTGRGQVQQKKGGGGAHNWGNELDPHEVNEIVDEVHKEMAEEQGGAK